MLNDYITRVSAHIKNKTAEKQIIAELESHIKDKISYYEELGYSREEAERRAVEEMGEAKDAAVPLNSLHKLKWYQDWFNIGAVIYLVILTVVLYMVTPYYLYPLTLPNPHIYHNIAADYISFGVVFSLIAFVILIYVKNSHFTAKLLVLYQLTLAAVTFLAIILIPVLNQREGLCISVYKPIIYVFDTIITNGFSSFTGSLISFNVYSIGRNWLYIELSGLLFAVMLAFSVIVMLKIIANEKIRPTKRYTVVIKSFASVLVVVLFSAAALTSVSMLYNLAAREQISVENHNLRCDIIDCVIDNNRRELEAIAEKYSLSEYNDDMYKTLVKYDNCIQFDNKMISYQRIDVENGGLDFFDSPKKFSPEDFIRFKKGSKLENFCDSGLIYDAESVQKNEDGISFVFSIDERYRDVLYSGNMYREDLSTTISFDLNGRLESNTTADIPDTVERFFDSIKTHDLKKLAEVANDNLYDKYKKNRKKLVDRVEDCNVESIALNDMIIMDMSPYMEKSELDDIGASYIKTAVNISYSIKYSDNEAYTKKSKTFILELEYDGDYKIDKIRIPVDLSKSAHERMMDFLLDSGSAAYAKLYGLEVTSKDSGELWKKYFIKSGDNAIEMEDDTFDESYNEYINNGEKRKCNIKDFKQFINGQHKTTLGEFRNSGIYYKANWLYNSLEYDKERDVYYDAVTFEFSDDFDFCVEFRDGILYKMYRKPNPNQDEGLMDVYGEDLEEYLEY